MNVEKDMNVQYNYIDLYSGTDEVKLRLIRHWDSNSVLEKELLLQITSAINNKDKEPVDKNAFYLTLLLLHYKDSIRTNIFEVIQSTFQREYVYLINTITSSLYNNPNTSLIEKSILIQFLLLCNKHIDIPFINTEMLKLSSIFIWVHLSPKSIQYQLHKNPNLIKNFSALGRLNVKEEGRTVSSPPCVFYNTLINDFLSSFESEAEAEFNNDSNEKLNYYTKVLELLIDLLSIFSTRKFMLPLLKEKHCIERIKLRSIPNTNFNQVLELFTFYYEYNIDEDKREYIKDTTALSNAYDELEKMQSIAYQLFPDHLTKLFSENISFTDSKDNLTKLLSALSHDEIYQLTSTLGLLYYNEEFYDKRTQLLKEIFIEKYARKPNVFDRIIEMPLYPTEELLYDTELIPDDYSVLDYKPLPIPKLSLQYLTYYDYLLKNYLLFKFESAYEIRNDIEDTVHRMCPLYDKNGLFTSFGGWSLMGFPITQFQIITVKPALIGEPYSNEVIGEIEYSLNGIQTEIRHEWDSLRKHDVLFLIHFNKSTDKPIIRGCEVLAIYDEDNKEFSNYALLGKEKPIGFHRRCLVQLDSVQYALDLQKQLINVKYNMIIRRKPKTNNFKPILQTIKSLMKVSANLPQWIEDVFLSFIPMKDNKKEIDYSFNYYDTFISKEHLDSIKLMNNSHLNNKAYTEYRFIKRNTIQFTPKQIEAIENGVYKGLTLIVGPPGTGKTNVAVQIVNVLHYNYPKEKILIITHSNYALNDIFEKIAQLNIDKKYLLRLGMGSKEMMTNKDTEEEAYYDYSVTGQINYLLERRRQLLEYVLYLANENNIHIFEEYTCESAINMINFYLMPKREDIELKMNIRLDLIINELKELRVFELLRDQSQRRNHLIKSQCRIIAMTCTHAALNRSNFISMGFEYDTVLYEESAQILEIETFIPLTLQKDLSRLKRVIMLGDNNQLPPIIKNSALKTYSEMDMSLFTRLLRNRNEYIYLDYQGRARESIVNLYRWKYPNLKDMPHVLSSSLAFPINNKGFNHYYQFIDVPDYDGIGERRTDDYSYQNLAEAEYSIGIFMFMCLIGYNANRIVILTPYNAQKDLIKEIYNKKCMWHKTFSGIKKIATIDKFQGQQSDFVILSFTRTKYLGHIRDMRRFIVSLSRARLGLYVLGRWELFRFNAEIGIVMDQFSTISQKLSISLPSNDDNSDNKDNSNAIVVNDFKHMYRIVQELIRIKLTTTPTISNTS